MTTTAWFVGLELEQEPKSDYVKYSFEFWEVYAGLTDKLSERKTTSSASSEASSGTAVYHTVVQGDTLWALAKKYSVTLSELVAWNSQIKNPNRIYVGQKVRVG
jgi:spore coat assembly protein SafA